LEKYHSPTNPTNIQIRCLGDGIS